MRRLILLRHGQAEQRASGGGDLDRALTERGAVDVAAVARALADKGFQPDLALVSTATRTVQTWESAAPAFEGAEAAYLSRLYDADAEAMWNLFTESEAETVIIVGHNPGIHHLAASLGRSADAGVDAQKLVNDFPPAASAAFEVAPGKVTLLAAVFPNDVR